MAHVIVVSANILTGDVGAEDLVPILVPIKYEARFSGMFRATVPLSAEKNPEFQRHVEPWQSVLGIETRPRQVVNAQPTLADNVKQLVESYLASVILLSGASRHETTVVDGEDESVEELFIPKIKGNVYEDCVRERRHLPVRV